MIHNEVLVGRAARFLGLGSIGVVVVVDEDSHGDDDHKDSKDSNSSQESSAPGATTRPVCLSPNHTI